jgi:hypothetical protein
MKLLGTSHIIQLIHNSGGLAVTQTDVFLFVSSQQVSAKVGHQQVTPEEIHKC